MNNAKLVQTSNPLASDSDLREFCDANTRAFTNVDPLDAIVYGLGGQGGWERLLARTPQGLCLVLRSGRTARTRFYDDAGNSEHGGVYALVDEDKDRYYRTQASPGGSKLVRVSSDALGDTQPVAVVGGREGPARVAELDQFYRNGGFLRVECSHDLPAEVLSEMLLVGYARVACAIQRYVEPSSEGRASAVA